MAKLESIKKQIEELEQSASNPEMLAQLRVKYYKEYFKVPRGQYTKLTDMPECPEGTKNILVPYGILPVDTVGKIIRDLIRKNEHLNVITRRSTHIVTSENGEFIEEPLFIIGKPENMVYQECCDENIILQYDPGYSLDKYPTAFPVNRVFLGSHNVEEYSNYRNMFGDISGLCFDPKGREYIYEMICNLAYLQYQLKVKQTIQQQIWDGYERIYKTRNKYD